MRLLGAGTLRLGERVLRGDCSFGRGVGSLCRERCRERRSRLLEDDDDEEDDEDDGVRLLFLWLRCGGGDSSTQSVVLVEGAGVADPNSV